MGTSSPSGETRHEWSGAMQPRWDRALNYLDRSIFPGGIDNANGDFGTYKPYTGQRFEPENFNQQAAYANSQGLMQGAASPLGSMNAASGQIQDTLGGRYMGGNPTSSASVNPWTDQFRNNYVGANKYEGMDNPAFKNMLQSGKEDITNSYNQGTSAELTRMMNMSGAFGGSAHLNAMANNQAALGKQLGQFESGMQNDQFNRSAGMEQDRLSRGFNSDESALGRGNQNWQSQQDRMSNAYESERGRQMGAIGLGQNEQGMAIDRGNWANDMGNQRQQQGQQQADFNYQQWTEAQNHPYKLLQMLMGNYQGAQGQTGNTSSSMYGSNAGAIGGGLMGLLAALG